MMPATTTTVTILGSGTCVPSLERSACSILIDSGDVRILVDSGAGTLRRLLEAGRHLDDISHIFYSHFHPDHTAELVPILFASKYPSGRSVRNPLTLCAGRGFRSFFRNLKTAYGAWIDLGPEAMTMIELDTEGGDSIQFEGVSVRSLPMHHNAESLAYRFTDRLGRAVVYSGDTDYTENLVALSGGADLLICEAAMPDELKVEGHLTPSLAGDIASRAGVAQLVLTHFYPECDRVDIRAQCRKTYHGPLVLAKDLMQIELGAV